MIAATDKNNSPTPYKKLLIQAKTLQATAKANVYDRVTLLVQVYDDDTFRLEHGADDFALANVLNQYLDDTGWDFLELRSILEHFPEREQWQENRLTKMHQEVMDKRRRKAQAKPTNGKPKRVTKADVARLEQDRRHWEARYRAAVARADGNREQAASREPRNGQTSSCITTLAAAEKRVAELEAENEALRNENRELRLKLREVQELASGIVLC